MLPPVLPRMRVLRLLLAAVLAATAAALAGDGGFWLALPVAAWLAGIEPTARDGVLSATLVLVLAAAAAPPAASVALLAAPAAVAVVLRVRVGLQREVDGLRRDALHDPLTGLHNRRSLDERLRHEVARHARARQRFAVLVLDLDGFKPVNDRFGHDAGDEVLREVAGALVGAVRAQDTVARLGGDEFCVVAPGTGEAGAQHLEARALEALGSVTAGMTGLSASVGTALYPDDGEDGAVLVAAADASVIEGKRRRYAGRPRRAAA